MNRMGTIADDVTTTTRSVAITTSITRSPEKTCPNVVSTPFDSKESFDFAASDLDRIYKTGSGVISITRSARRSYSGPSYPCGLMRSRFGFFRWNSR